MKLPFIPTRYLNWVMMMEAVSRSSNGPACIRKIFYWPWWRLHLQLWHTPTVYPDAGQSLAVLIITEILRLHRLRAYLSRNFRHHIPGWPGSYSSTNPREHQPQACRWLLLFWPTILTHKDGNKEHFIICPWGRHLRILHLCWKHGVNHDSTSPSKRTNPILMANATQ